jgi:hypothetical protein
LAQKNALMGIFSEIDPVVVSLDQLRALGISDDDMSVLSSLPYTHEMLGRPHKKTILPVISLVSTAIGLLVGVFYNVITPQLYTIHVGGQAIVPGPPTAVLLYEFAMIFLIIGTFLGMVWLNEFPSFKGFYHPKITDGRIALLLHCTPEQKDKAQAIMEAQGAEEIQEPERRTL